MTDTSRSAKNVSQRARDGRGAHVELVRHDAAAHGFAFLGRRWPTPTMLLVDDGQAQPVEFDMVLDQRLRADHQLHAALGHGGGPRAAPWPSGCRSSRRCSRPAAATTRRACGSAVRPGFRWAPSAPPGPRPRWPGPRRWPRPRSCRCPRRPATGDASDTAAPGLRRFRTTRCCASQRTAGFRTAGPPARPARRWAAAARLPDAPRGGRRPTTLLRQQLVERCAAMPVNPFQQRLLRLALRRRVQRADGGLEQRQRIALARHRRQGVGQVGAIQRLRDGAAASLRQRLRCWDRRA